MVELVCHVIFWTKSRVHGSAVNHDFLAPSASANGYRRLPLSDVRMPHFMTEILRDVALITI